MKTTTLTLVDGARVVVPDSLALMTPYVLREQGDWFEDDIGFVRQILEPGDAVIDIGANHGVYTLSMAKAVGPTGRVWAYEPASGVRGFLQRSVVENGFEARVQVEGKALSNRRGEALLSINIQPELNTLNSEAAGGEQESVPLTSLDDELAAQGWADIALMKMDAEGEEGRILEGATGFFATLSPLVLFEIKAGLQAQLGLVDAFGRLGYGCYRLLPGLGLLLPFDPASPVDGYLLNLYACKPDRARRLIERGLLCDVTCAVMDAAEPDPASWGGKPPAGAWRHELEARPYAAALWGAWRKREPLDARLDEALTLYARAHEAEHTPAVRVACLRRCQALLRAAQRERPSDARRATLARVDFELGERSAAVSAVGALAHDITRSGQVDLSEPFLPPLLRFDTLPVGTEPTKWFLASVLEACETWGAFSSFFTGAAAQRSLQSIASLGYAGPEMTRRLSLVQQRFGVAAATALPAPAATTAPAVRPCKPGPAVSAGETLAKAQGQLAASQVASAEAALMPLLDDAASRPEALYLLAVAAVMAGRADDALLLSQDAVAAAPADPRCQFALGRAHKLGGRLPEAVAAYRHALELDPGYVEAHVSLGVALKQMGALDEALACHTKALALQPGLAVAQANLALVKEALAARAAQHLPAVEPQPQRMARPLPGTASAGASASASDRAAAHFDQGLQRLQAGERAAAIQAFDRALGAQPSNLGYCLRFGHELEANGAAHQAAALYENWLRDYGQQASVMRALANVLVTQGQAGAAIAWSQRAAALDPGPLSWLQLCNAYQQGRRQDEGLAAGRQAISQSGQQWNFYSLPLMVSNYVLEEPQALADLHAEFGRALAGAVRGQPGAPVPATRRARTAGQPLRVGYVSPDFVNHSVAYFMGPILEHHDRSRFEIHCFHNRPRSDDMTLRLQALGHRWTECAHWSDEALFEHIRAEGIDVLVDLAGHTANGRLRLFALAPAPVQVSYLGYPTWSGVQTVAHRITDSTIDPGDLPSTGSERPLCLPRPMFCYRAPEAPTIGPPPSLQQGFVTFGTFNNLAKLSDHCLALWARVLHAVPGSKLLIKAGAVADPANQDNLQRFMAAQGIDGQRLILMPQTAVRSSHLALYDQIDVGLDSFPHNGATTTCEALWMGVPVVTQRGNTHTSRLGASLLGAVGQSGWVTGSDDDFVATAQQLALDLPARSQWRLQARQTLRASPLMDELGFVRDFEAALLQAWDHGQPKAG